MTTAASDAETFQEMILESWNAENPVSFVLFTSPNCAHCGPLKEIVQKAEEAFEVPVGYVNVYHAVAAASESKVRAVPTLVKFSRGQETGRLVGAQTLEAVMRFISNG